MSKTPANDKSEAVAEACAHLNNHALPNVYALTVALQDMVRYVEAVDMTYSGDDPRVSRARQMIRDLRPHLGANI